jgi:hypothetical protein
MRRLVLFVAASLTGACGSDIPKPSNQGTPCTISLTGAVNARLSCGNVTGLQNGSQNTTFVSFLAGSPGTAQPSFSGMVGWTGGVRTGTFQSTDADADGELMVSGPGTWEAATSSAGFPTTGSYTVSVTSFSVTTPSSGGSTGFLAHGTLTAELPAFPGGLSSGTVTAQGSF